MVGNFPMCPLKPIGFIQWANPMDLSSLPQGADIDNSKAIKKFSVDDNTQLLINSPLPRDKIRSNM